DFKFLSDFLSPALNPIRFPSSVLRGSEHRLPDLSCMLVLHFFTIERESPTMIISEKPISELVFIAHKHASASAANASPQCHTENSSSRSGTAVENPGAPHREIPRRFPPLYQHILMRSTGQRYSQNSVCISMRKGIQNLIPSPFSSLTIN
ncbi:hypothetical protein Goshw_024941, partial [Gossypium schwendimanii]|nr:hypothetical protein [Gossypium schwendimanii]